jgi:hypothetical protein
VDDNQKRSDETTTQRPISFLTFPLALRKSEMKFCRPLACEVILFLSDQTSSDDDYTVPLRCCCLGKTTTPYSQQQRLFGVSVRVAAARVESWLDQGHGHGVFQIHHD